MKTLKDCSDKVAELFEPIFDKSGAKLTNSDVIRLHAICGYAALQILQDTEKGFDWGFSGAALGLGITDFEGCPEFNRENKEALYHGAWWASFTWDEWLDLSEWCIALRSDRKKRIALLKRY